MNYMADICRICLQHDKLAVDIMKNKDEPTSLLQKLHICVSEVEWSSNNPLMLCQTCVAKLNAAFEFKKQCLQSVQAFENYLFPSPGDAPDKAQPKVSVSNSTNNTSQDAADENAQENKNEDTSSTAQKNNLLNIKPEQLFNVDLNSQGKNANTFQNIFLNLIPANLFSKGSEDSSNNCQAKDGNQNTFMNVNNALHKLYPFIPPTKENLISLSALGYPNLINSFGTQNIFGQAGNILNQFFSVSAGNSKTNDTNVFRLLKQNTTEDVSVEIDPAYFDCVTEEGAEGTDDANETGEKDWEELISSSKIGPETLDNGKKSKAQDGSFSYSYEQSVTNTSSLHNSSNNTPSYENFNQYYASRTQAEQLVPPDFEENFQMFNNGHFMTPLDNLDEVAGLDTLCRCEECGQIHDSVKALNFHIKQLHLGKFPYKCMHCYTDFAMRSQYETHMQKHIYDAPCVYTKDTITLEDLSKENAEAMLFPHLTKSLNKDAHYDSEASEENGVQREHQCNQCSRSFSSYHGLTRHRVRKHKQNKKKYFVKGMKNAKCDICQREFSTQSYLQLHIKLHYRRNEYRRKVFDKDKYGRQKKDSQDNSNVEDSADASKEKTDNEEDTLDIDATDNVDKKENDTETELDVSLEKESNRNDVTSPDLKTENEQNDSKEISGEVTMGSGEGIKIKINLKNIKQSNEDAESSSENNTKVNSEHNDSAQSKDGKEDSVGERNDENEHAVNGTSENCSTNSPHSEKMDESMCANSNDGTFLEGAVNVDFSEETRSCDDTDLMDIDPSTEQYNTYSGYKYDVVDGKPKCNFCNKLFSRKHDLKRHMNNIHLKSIEYQCHICHSKFYEAFHLTRHLRQHNSFLCCITCTRKFNILRDLKYHIMSAHDGVASSQCGACGEIFNKIKNLKEHMQLHDKSIVYKCHLCGIEFVESRELTRHLVGHSGMYSCGLCQITFSTEHELTIHYKVHTAGLNEKMYECEICHNRYKRKRYLANHVNHCHKVNKKNVEIIIDRVPSDYSEESMCNMPD